MPVAVSCVMVVERGIPFHRRYQHHTRADEPTAPRTPKMHNGVGLATTKGVGMSGFMERSKAFAAVRSQYSFHPGSSGPGGAKSAAAKRAALAPQEAAKQYVADVLSQREAAELVARLTEHAKLRSIKLKVVEMKQRLQNEAESSGKSRNDPEIDRRVKEVHAALLQEYIDEAEKAEAARLKALAKAAEPPQMRPPRAAGGKRFRGRLQEDDDDDDAPKPEAKTADAFRRAFGVAHRAETDASAFDRQLRAERKESEAEYRERREREVVEQVVRKVTRDAEKKQP